MRSFEKITGTHHHTKFTIKVVDGEEQEDWVGCEDIIIKDKD